MEGDGLVISHSLVFLQLHGFAYVIPYAKRLPHPSVFKSYPHFLFGYDILYILQRFIPWRNGSERILDSKTESGAGEY